jgi:oligopeptidase B
MRSRVFLTGVMMTAISAASPISAAPPVAAERPVTTIWHGEPYTDAYAWLRDPGYPKVDSPEILAHLEAENRWYQAHMAPLQPLVATLFEELKGRVTPDDASVPVKNGRA